MGHTPPSDPLIPGGTPSGADPAATPATPAPTPAPAADPAGSPDDPAAAGRVAAVQAERAKRQAAETELAALKKEAADREAADRAAALKKRGEWETLANEAKARAAAAERTAARLEQAYKLRDAHNLPDDGVKYALYLIDEAERGGNPVTDLDAFATQQVAEGGALFRFVQPATQSDPKGTRNRPGGPDKVPVPAWIVEEAAKSYAGGGQLYKHMSAEEHAEYHFRTRYGGKDPKAAKPA